MKPQTKAVGDYLLRHGKITPLEALRKLGIFRLGARVYELRHDHGMSIMRGFKRVRTRDGWTRVAEYMVKDEDCGNCHECLKDRVKYGWPVTALRIILCPTCGNKRCPKATNHRLACTDSNEAGQAGSIYK